MLKTKELFLTLFVALALVLGATACSDDDDNNNNNNNNDAGVSGADSSSSTADTGSTEPDAQAVTFKLCQEECSSTDDCETGGQNLAGLECNDADRCMPSGCSGNDDCLAQGNGWITSCTDDSGCIDGFVCISDAGGVCAQAKPSAPVTCETLTRVDYETTKQDGGEAVTVCAMASLANPICNTETGLCGCATDPDTCGEDKKCLVDGGTCGCANNNGCAATILPECNTTTGGCECTKDPNSCGENQQCLDSGACGCGNDDGCTTEEQPSCDTTTGACKCTETSCDENEQCLDSGACGCANDDACVGNPTGTKCNTELGICVCEDAAADCPTETNYDGTTYVCEVPVF
jgi:hypothetical protein